MRKLPSAVRKNKLYDIFHTTTVFALGGAFLITTGMLLATMTKLMTVDKSKYLEDQRIIEEARIAKLQMEEEEARLKSSNLLS